MKIIGIIPARYGSTRFPGKPLVDIGGTSMIMRVYQQALKSDLTDVIVATDDNRILNHVVTHGGKAVLTSKDHPSGTDRVLEAALQCKTVPDSLVNIQGDEPFIAIDSINKIIELIKKEYVQIATLVKPFDSIEELENPNRVKAIVNDQGKALSFSRKIHNPKAKHFQHLGIYAYKMETLKTICKLAQSPLELEEKLEQLRWFENGIPIYTSLVNEVSLCVDTPEDLEKIRKSLAN